MSAPALVAVDESTSGQFVTAGAVFVSAGNIPYVTRALIDLKTRHGIPPDAEIHCRELFAGDKRRKGHFKSLAPDAIIPFLVECILRATGAGCLWYAVHCDSTTYPSEFSMFEGNRSIAISSKHIAAHLVATIDLLMATVKGEDFQLSFDKDSTKLDWGMARRMQATGMIAQSNRAVDLLPSHQPFLELADLVAYAYGHSLSSQLEPDNRKLSRFRTLVRAMQLHSWTFAWPPGVSLDQ